MFRIAVLDDYQNVASEVADWSPVAQAAEVAFFSDHLANGTELVARLRSFDCVVLMRERTPLSEDVLTALPQLKLIVTTGPTNAAIDTDVAERLGIPVIGTDVATGLSSTVELTWALILSLARGIVRDDTNVRKGLWQRQLGVGLQGKRLGIVGLGRIGSRVAQVAQAFGMQAVAWSENLARHHAEAVGASHVSREDLFSTSDFVSVHLKSSLRSHKYITESDIGLMRPSAFFVNTSRAAVVDNDALLRALVDRRIAGAGLDVFGVEPLPEAHALTALDNTVLTPHVGYVTQETYEGFYGQAVEGILAYLRDGTLLRPIRAP